MSCFVKSCKNYWRKCKKDGLLIQFHRFPTNNELRQNWIQICGRGPEDFKPSSRVCSQHFELTEYANLDESILRHDAKPSLKLEDSQTLGTSEQTHAVTATAPGPTAINTATAEELMMEILKWKDAFLKLKEESNQLKKHLRSRLNQATRISQRWRADKKHLIAHWKKKFHNLKNDLAKLKSNARKYTRQGQNIARQQKQLTKTNHRVQLLESKFTPTQVNMISGNKTKTVWTEQDIAKAICLRSKSPAAYEIVRSQWKLPLPTLRTLRRWTQNIILKPGLIFPVLNLLKYQFAGKSMLERICVICFDEVGLDGTICYDPTEDKILGPHSNLVVVFARGLFSKWKQVVYYGYDDKLTDNLPQIITALENANLHVVAMTCDNAPTNKRIWNKLGVTHENPSFPHPCSDSRVVHCFSDLPHLGKLIRNHLIDHGFILSSGTRIGRPDLEKVVKTDTGESKICPNFTPKHLEVQGTERQNVRMAFQTLSGTVAAALTLLFPDEPEKGAFIQLCNDFLDVMNSRCMEDPNPMKRPLGTNLEVQFAVLDKMEHEVRNMSVGGRKGLLPFQKGVIMSIKSVKALYLDLSTNLKIKYIFTARLNQDVAENAFSILRSFGKFKHTMDPIDVKYRLRMLLLSWHLMSPQSTAPVCADTEIEDAQLLSSTLLRPLLEDTTPATKPWPIPDSKEEELCELPLAPVKEISEGTWKEYNEQLTLKEEAEFGGLEYIAGFLCRKLDKTFDGMTLPTDSMNRTPQSWSQSLSIGGLKIPSYEWLNSVREMNRYFVTFHKNPDSKIQFNQCPRVIETLARRIHCDLDDLQYEIIHAFVKLRTFLRIRHLNAQLNQMKWLKKKTRKLRMITRSAALGRIASNFASQQLGNSSSGGGSEVGLGEDTSRMESEVEDSDGDSYV